jgi:23S rRNA (adenine2030-N6)-methyltransferase
MLSYQHGYHAGGFADVHKHAALCLLLDHLLKKPAPFCAIDTHAGRGLYDLRDAQASKTGEWRGGIGQLAEAAPRSEGLSRYLAVVRTANGGGRIDRYPGSPAIAAAMMRSDDRLVLIEGHPAEFEALRSVFRRDTRVHIHKRDSLEALPALVPPAEKRGLVLVDPSYEVKAEYTTVPRAIGAALKRWEGGIYAVWYPILPDGRHEALVRGLAAERETLVAELHGPQRDQGLVGTGLAVINPPWQFAERLAEAGDEAAMLVFGKAGRHVIKSSGAPA